MPGVPTNIKESWEKKLEKRIFWGANAPTGLVTAVPGRFSLVCISCYLHACACSYASDPNCECRRNGSSLKAPYAHCPWPMPKPLVNRVRFSIMKRKAR